MLQREIERKLYEMVVKHYPFDAVHQLLSDFGSKCFADGLLWGVVVGGAFGAILVALVRRK